MTNDNKNFSDNHRSYIYSIIINDETASSSTPLAATVSAPNYIKRHQLNNNNNNNFNNYISNINIKQNDENNVDRYLAYRRLCEIRTRRLERYKKARSFCSLHDESDNNIKITNTSKNIDFDCNNNYGKLDNTSRITSSSCSHLLNDIKDNKLNQFVNLSNQTQNSKSNNNFLYLNENENNQNQKFNLEKPLSYNDLLFSNYNINKRFPNDSIPLQNESKKLLTADLSNKQNENFVNNNFYQNNKKQLNTFKSQQQQQISSNCQYEILRDKMISMMENDVQILKKLLTLGETIQELRKNSGNNNDDANSNVIAPSLSNSFKKIENELKTNNLSTNQKNNVKIIQNNNKSNKINSNNDKNKLDKKEDKLNSITNNHYSSINKLFIGNNEQNNIDNNQFDNTLDDDEDYIPPNVQYFSRKNSVLRIPIPPRSSNRMQGKRLPFRSDLLRYSRNNAIYKSTKISTPVEEDSGHSSASNSPPAQCSPNSTINTNLNKNMEEFNNSIKKLTNSSKLLDEAATNDLGQALSDFDTTSTIDSGSSRYSTFSLESFLLTNSSNDCIEKNDTNVNNISKMIERNANIINADAPSINNVNIVAVNLDKCIISN